MSNRAAATVKKTFIVFYTLAFFNSPKSLYFSGFQQSGEDKKAGVWDKKAGVRGQKSGCKRTKKRVGFCPLIGQIMVIPSVSSIYPFIHLHCL